MARSRDALPARIAGAGAALFGLVGLGLVASLVVGGWRVLGEPAVVANVLSNFWDPLKGRYGLGPFVAGTITVSVIALMVAVPLALATAVVASQNLSRWAKDILSRGLDILTAVPSVIFGWWGIQMVVPWVRAHTGGPGFSLLAAGLVLALMVLPTLGLFFFHALERVPRTYREASLALGGTPDQTLTRVVLRCALPGLVNGLLVGVARAVGETMAVQMVIGGNTTFPTGVAAPGATLTTQIVTDMTAFPPGTRGHAVLDVMALLLMVGMYVLVRLSERWGASA
ncbi:ABC transporter permease subunit [Sulfobacillus sp. DSM 109850]|uniref:ABC transporter permease subunit n=2 Tax=Sulfobacillus harzensis TaxID=2729629 RepID=A0A7Y0L2L0_9FIRM|nr:ABC transporter permease subunit [Sulfobacillus harzensis]